MTNHQGVTIKSLHKMNNNVDNVYKFRGSRIIILHNIDYFFQIYGNNKMDYTSLSQYKISLTHSILKRHTVLDTSATELKMIKAGRIRQKWQQLPSNLHVSDIIQSACRAVTYHGGWTQAEQTHRGCHSVDVDSTYYADILDVVVAPAKRLGINIISEERLVVMHRTGLSP